MVAEAQRGVMFTLKVQEDEQAAAIMKRFGAKLGKLDTERAATTERYARQSGIKQTDMVREQLEKQCAAVRAAATKQDTAVVESVAVQKTVREKQTRDFMAEQKKQAAIVESSKAKMASSTTQMSSAMSALGTGIVSVGQGWAYLGISSKETSEEMIKALLKVQGVVQLARGGIDIYRGITEGVRAYRLGVEAATAAQKALAAAQVVTGATGLAAGGGAGRRGMGVAGTVGVAGTASVATTKAGAVLGGGPALLGASALAAIAGLTGAIVTSTEAYQDARQYGVGGGASPDSASAKIAETEAAVVNLLGKLAGFDPHGDLKTKRFEKTQASERDFATAIPSLIQDAIRAQMQLQPMSGFEIGQRVRSHEALQAKMTADAGVDPSRRVEVEAKINAYRKEGAAILAGEIATAEKRRDIARQEGIERIKTADELIAKANTQADAYKSIADQQKAKLQSAAERFALMDPEQQRELIQLKQRATQGEKLSPEQYQKLGGVGTARAGSLASKGLQDIAEQKGFSEHFGEAERETIKATDRAQEGLKLFIEDQRKFSVEMRQNDDKIIKLISDEIEKKAKQSTEYILAGVRQEIERSEEAIRRTTDQRLAARAALQR